ncbi:hypothetical protein RCL1_001107 [Eukaryota sp. TZLM3-RCL]
MSISSIWKDRYLNTVPETLSGAKNVTGVVSAFNSNIDAILPVSGADLSSWISRFGFSVDELLADGVRAINTPSDLFRGIIRCFQRGIAEEWLIFDEDTFKWTSDNLGYKRLQMGGQGGIVANAAAVSGVQNVYVHCASLPKEQSQLFLPLDNLKSFTTEGELVKASDISRNDLGLIHWIIEFSKGDTLELPGHDVIICPKSNRFIATFDPLNLTLTIDPAFRNVVKHPFSLVFLSGYHMLTSTLPDGRKSRDRIIESLEVIDEWKKNRDVLVHLELASTQDETVRREIVDLVAPHCHSTGCNERELIDVLMVVGEEELAGVIDKDTSAVNVFKGLVRLFTKLTVDRIQLHMFGLYITVQRREFRSKLSLEKNLRGMLMAAVVASSKASTGEINSFDSLTHSLRTDFTGAADHAIKELTSVSEYIANEMKGPNTLAETGIVELPEFDVIAAPTIIVPRPKTLVGMGDTIGISKLIGAL